MRKKTRIRWIIGIVLAVSVLVIIGIIISQQKARLSLRERYEALSGIHENIFTKEITNAPKGNSPEEAYHLYFKNGVAYNTFEYDEQTCVLGNTAIGDMIATVVSDKEGTYRVNKVFDRDSDRRHINMTGIINGTSQYIQFYKLPGSKNPNEIVLACQMFGNTIPSDTNKATYFEIHNSFFSYIDSDLPFRHWYAFSDTDQKGYCIIWYQTQDVGGDGSLDNF